MERPSTQKKVVVGFDCNESFDFAEDQVASRTASGETILTWILSLGLHLPAQQGSVPSFFPYNTAQQPRRLDYGLTKGIHTAEEGRVFCKSRTMMASDHAAVGIMLHTG